jgi:hypothetical protein
MPRIPERPPQTEAPRYPFLLASRFDSRETSQTPYDTIQTIVREQEASEFSVFRMIQNWLESMSKAPSSPKRWYVAVIGYPPPEPLLTKVTEAINQGEPVPLPDEVVSVMTEKRLQEISKRPYTEIHRTFTARRKKEKDMIYGVY